MRRRRVIAMVLGFGLVRLAWAFDSHCGAGAVTCDGGYSTARTRWGVVGGVEEGSAEHRTIWLRSRVASGLPASLDADIELPVFTADVELPGGFQSVRPVLRDSDRAAVRVTSLAEMTQLPDFSYTLWDWAMGNELCPPDGAQDPIECHEYFPHIGLLNSNHMVPQAQRFYDWYHALAVARAGDCRAVHDLVPADHRERFLPYVLACEKEALLLEAVGQHFLQDAWSMGHMWERWGGPEVSDFGGDRTVGAAIAAFTGIIHGARSLLGEGFDDPLCAPHPGVGYVDGNGAPGDHLGLGDVFVDSVLLPSLAGTPYGEQRRALLGCAVDGMRAVYAATARAHGALGDPDGAAADTSRRVVDASCWGQRATNQALAVGFGLHVGSQPNQTPLLEVYDPLLEVDNGALPAGVIAWALSTYASRIGLTPLDPVTADRFRHDAAEAATLAATHGADPETGLQTTLASGGLPPLVGIGPNSQYARGGDGSPPSTYSDPPLPWGLIEAGTVGERKQALALLFADAHVAERCNELTAADVEAYRASVDAAGDDPDRRDAACGQCALMAMPHLRFGVPGNHDARREALCHFVSAGAGFVYTEEDPNSFSGVEPTDLASLRSAARDWCGCGGAFTLIAEEGTFLFMSGDAPSINDDGRVAFTAVATEGQSTRVWTGDGGEASILDYVQITGGDGQTPVFVGRVGSYVGDLIAFGGNEPLSPFTPAVFVGSGGPIQTAYAGPEVGVGHPPPLNASGTTTFIGFDPTIGDLLYVASNGTKQALHQTMPDGPDALDRIDGLPDLNDAGAVAFFGSFRTAASGPCDDFILRGTGDVPVRVAGGGSGFDCTDGVFRGTKNTIGLAIDETGRIAFIASPLLPPAPTFSEAVVVDTTVAASTLDGAFAMFGAVALDATGGLVFLAQLPDAQWGIFRGPDPVADRVVVTGDALFGSTVASLSFHRYGVNASGQIAFGAELADGRRVVVRADP